MSDSKWRLWSVFIHANESHPYDEWKIKSAPPQPTFTDDHVTLVEIGALREAEAKLAAADKMMYEMAGDRLEKEWPVLRENERLRAALESIRDAPGLGGLDHGSTKKWREVSMKVIDQIARAALEGA